MSKRKHLFYIADKEGQTLAVRNGVVTASGLRQFLQFAPLGSKEVQFIYERDKEKLALFRTFSTVLEFIRDGRKILQHTHYNENEEKELYLLLQQFNEVYSADYFEEIYRTIYKGRLDFYTAEDADSSFSISIAESSLVKQMTAGEGTVFEHSLNDPEAVTLYHDGVRFNYKQNFILTESIPINYGDDGLALPGLQETTSEGTPAGVAFFSVFYDEAEPSDSQLASDTRYFMRCAQSVETIRLKGSVKFYPSGYSGFYQLQVKTSTGRIIDLVTMPVGTATAFYEASFDVTFSGSPDERFFLFHVRSGANVKTVQYVESTVEAFVTSTYNASYIETFPINVLHRKAVAKITGSEVHAQSELLNLNDRLLVTSGDGLRALPDAVVKTSHKDIFQAAKVLLFAGQSIEGDRVKIESLERFFQTADPIELGEVKDFSVSEVDDFMFTEVKVGYASQTLDEVQGKMSFHNTLTYTTPRKSAEPKTLSLICPFIADPYAQEVLRINLAGKDSTDTAGDNKVYIIDSEEIPATQFNAVEFIADAGRYFMKLTDNAELFPFFYKKVTVAFPIFNQVLNIISTARDGNTLTVEVKEAVTPEVRDVVISFNVRRIRRPAGVVLTGVPNPEKVYNVLLSPATIAHTWQKWINSLLFNFEGEKLTFVSTEKNKEAAYTFQGRTIDEDAALTIGKDRLFKAKYFNFTVPAPRNMNSLLEAAPNRGFSAVGRGILVEGFAEKVSIAVVDNSEQSFKLLCGPTVDLSRFA